MLGLLYAPLAAKDDVAIYPDAQWPVATPAEAGLNADRLNQARDYALTGQGSGMIIRGGRLVLAWGDRAQRYDLKSTTKSFGAIALGLAIADGKVKLDDPAIQYQPSLGVPPAENKATGWIGKITLYHLLTQTAGFEKPGGYNKLLFEPGTQWRYSDAGPNWLADCLTLLYARDLNDLMFERVFTPIGISKDDLVWRKNQYREKTIGDGIARREFGAGISANVEAMSRIGYLMLRGGRWKDKQLLPADYVGRCGRPQPDVAKLSVHDDPNHVGAAAHYGLLWWNNGDGALAGVPRDAYWSWGLFDSVIVVVPSQDLVIARAGKSWQRKKDAAPYDVLKPFLGTICAAVDLQGGAPANRAKPQATGEPNVLSEPRSTGTSRPAPDAPYPASSIIRRMEIDWSAHKRDAQGSDNWQLTWADDDHQYAAWGDGGGFGGTNSLGRASLGVARVEGPADGFRGVNIFGGVVPSTIDGKSWGMICVGGNLYMWVSPKSPLKAMQSEARLYRSADHGRSWSPADWAFTRADGLTIPTICQFGRDYAGAIDEYVYHYFIHPRDDSAPDLVQRPGTLYLARTPKDRLMDRDAYEFYAGLVNRSRQPRWTKDLTQLQPVFEDPNGIGWCMSVSYNAGLRRFILMTEHGEAPRGLLGVFDAPTPWGPWTTVTYLDQPFGREVPNDQVPANVFFWNIPTKWQSADGQTFAVVFTGAGRGKNNDSFNLVRGRFVLAADAKAAGPDRLTKPQALEPPYPLSPVIRRVEWAAPDTVTHQAKGSDNWPTTWADDDHQYTAYGDGWGFQRDKADRKLSIGVARIEGSPSDARGIDIPAPSIEGTGDDVRGQKASGMLCVEGMLYMWLRNAGNSQLAWSADHGKTWERAAWKFTTSFGCPTFLNAGRNYADAQDGYAYVYSFDADSAYTAADRMVLARVPKGRIREREAYEFYAGKPAGEPAWTADVAKRTAVFEHAGKCYRSNITYAPGIKRYLWVQMIPGKERTDRRGLAIFDAPAPWGPWTTAFYAAHWDIDPGDSAVLPAKWIASDGRSAHLIFAGDDSFSVRELRFVIDGRP